MESPSFKTHNQYDRFRNRRNRFVLSVTVFLLCALAGFYYFSPDDLEKEKAPGPISVWSDPATGEPLGWLNEDGTFFTPVDLVSQKTPSQGRSISPSKETITRPKDQHLRFSSTSSEHNKMIALLQDIAERTPDENSFLGTYRARRLRTMVTQEPPGATAIARCGVYYHLGMYEQNLGNEETAIEFLTKAYDLLDEVQVTLGSLPSRVFNETAYRLGISYFRLGETQNCCQQRSPESCIFPIHNSAIHSEKEGSQKAIEYFMQVLEKTPHHSTMHIKTRWLLNLAHMTLGNFPDSVPAQYRLDHRSFEPSVEFPHFHNIAAELGLDTFSMAGGAIVEDFNNDGHLDLIVSPLNPAGQIRYFQNDGQGSFLDSTQNAGLEGLCGGLNLLQADYDNDGDMDILILRGAWLGSFGKHPSSLLRNDHGIFADVTFSSGLGDQHFPTQTASWSDFDNDGDLDLYIGNEDSQSISGNFGPQQNNPGLKAPCQLFQNNGDGTFEDIADQAGVENLRFTKAVVWGDYNNDGFSDLFLSNLGQPNRLYHNNGNGTFTDRADVLSITKPIHSFPAWFWDFNNDGILDIYVSSYQGTTDRVADVVTSLMGGNPGMELACLYMGDGKGGFSEVSDSHNLTQLHLPMGANFGDLDADGYLDFYLGTGYPDYEALMPNAMFWNQGGTHFLDVTVEGGFGHLQKGHAVVFADIDNDGDQDIFEQMGGNYPGDKYANVLYENPGFGNNWIGLKLIGTQSNRSGLGARIEIQIRKKDTLQSIFKNVVSGGSFGANPMRQFIGLGQAEVINWIEIQWPGIQSKQRFLNIPMNQFFRIIEGQNSCVPYSITPINFSDKPLPDSN